MPKEIRDLPASVRERLRNYAKEHGEDFSAVLTRYGVERFLYRLGESALCDQFLLKGATLFSLWFDRPHRPTRDIDLLGYGPNGIGEIESDLRKILAIECEDGMSFEPDTIKGVAIREDLPYQGVRIKFLAKLGNTKIPFQVDIGSGDAVTPAPEKARYPTMLDFPAPNIKVYPKESVMAEKFEAIVRFGLGNGRMKDYWDLRYMIEEFEFEGHLLQSAVQATFMRRETSLPTTFPIGLTEEFATNSMVLSRWQGFVGRNQIGEYTELVDTLAKLREFFSPIIQAEADQNILTSYWENGAWR